MISSASLSPLGDALDASLRAEELDVLAAIFGDDCDVDVAQRSTSTSSTSSSSVRIHLPSRARPSVIFEAHLPHDYPSTSPPVLLLTLAGQRPGTLSATDVHEVALSNISALWTPGSVCIFDMVRWLQEQSDLVVDEPDDEAFDDDATADEDVGASGREGTRDDAENGGTEAEGDEDGAGGNVKRAFAPPSYSPLPLLSSSSVSVESSQDTRRKEEVRDRIIHGDVILERKSSFQAHLLPTKDAMDVPYFVSCLLDINKVRNATHNIMAYRISSVHGYAQDCDDDGEDAAGGRLLHLLQLADCKDVVVVVSRWFGGVLLGPSRFALINNAARGLLEREGFIERKEKKKGKK